MLLFLLDGHAIVYRSYFAFIRNPLTNSKGENTSAAFGFLRVLLLLMKKYRPDYIAVVFDSGEETERHRVFPDYKANRQEMPDDLSSQLPVIFDLLEAMGVPVLIRPGYEADDILATIASEVSSRGIDVRIVTGDKDLFQLLSGKIRIIRPSRGSSLSDEIGPEYIEERYGLRPDQIVDLLALMGDSSDNIPGVRGVGEKTALKLLHRFGTLDGILENIENVKPGHVKKKIADDMQSALDSRELVTLKDVPIRFSMDELAVGEQDDEKLTDILIRLEFHQIIEELSLNVSEEKDEVDYNLVDEDGLEELAGHLRLSREFVLDAETTSLDAMKAELVGISFCTGEGRAWYVPVSAGEPEKDGGLFGGVEGAGGPGVPLERIRGALENVLSDRRIGKIGHNIKYDSLVLEANGLHLEGVSFDTMIASYCLDPERRSHSLDNLALEFCRHRMIPFKELFPPEDRSRDIRTVPVEKLAHYSCEDADYTLRLRDAFGKKLKESGIERLFEEVEMPLSLVLKRMEREGVAVDIRILEGLSGDISKELGNLTVKIHELSGEEFNINSNKQLQHILFEKLGLPAARRTKTGYSTDVEVLTELAAEHPIAGLVLEFRQLTKMTSTYIDALPRLVNPSTGRIHTSFNQTVVATGRLSSSNPNLQNIPVRTELGRKIRSAFIPREGNILMDADYSQIELRIMAHLSGDAALIEAFREEADIHVRTAARIHGVDEGLIDDEMRSRAKTINFGVMYGMGPRGLSRQLGISLEEAGRFIEEYFETYPGVKEYIDRSIESARENHYAETLLGRRRPLPDIDSEDGRVRSFSERIAVNMPIQGTAADMIKVAMIDIDRAISGKRLKSRMILQVHDELVFDVPTGEKEIMEGLVRELMESALELEVPLRVDIGTGNNWLEAH